ncbi:sulfite exporter TauE/SafE family protein [Candidatus Microgenomates bacterium]|nr:sulfite exporter TauE/SafE family protein [Candidatus Microgenomates bacterium]
MSTQKEIIDITGMHCRSCEMLVESELLKVPGVIKVVANQNIGTAEIFHKERLNEKRIEQAVLNAGYSLGKDVKPWLSRKPKDYRDLAVSVFIILNLYLLAKYFGIFDLNLVKSSNYSSLPIVLLIGITAGLSTCMALVGGLVLGASARFVEKHPNATPLEKFKPHIFFNLGRIATFFILGGVIGFAGSIFQLSSSVLGVLTIIVGVVMFILGAQLTEISPAIKSLNFSLPKSISRLLGLNDQNEKEYTHKGSAVMGGLTFFLPCGFTQAMQLYAISSGNIVTGALTMGIFAIGTAPGLLGIGGLTSIVKGAIGRLFFKTAGLIVLLLAIFNISNGYYLTGFNPAGIFATAFLVTSNTPAENVSDSNVTLENGVQIVRMTQDGSGYHPNSFNIKKGIPVKWIINSTNAYSCAASIFMQQYGVRKGLNPGENIIEFTPTESGRTQFTCSMGMYRGVFNVN